RQAREVPLALRRFVVAIVALDESGPATIGVGFLFREVEVRSFETVVIGLDEFVIREVRTFALRRLHMFHDPVGNRLGIAEAVRMMRLTVLDHYRDPSTQLLITILNQESV